MFDDDKEQDVPNSGMDLRSGSAKTADAYSRNAASEPKAVKPHVLDSDDMQSKHRKLLAMYEDELDKQGENRAQQATDADFYDNIQWREEDIAILKERGQAPLVYNVIASSINWVLGTEKRGRTDYKILPRRKDAGKPAERKTQLMKYLSDVNRSPFHRSRAFEDAVKVGIGWLETGVQDDDEGEPVYVRYESWRNMLWDSASTEKDFSDSRYVLRTKWIDLDIALAMFPDRAGILRGAVNQSRAYGPDAQGDEVMDSQEDATQGYATNRSSVGVFDRERVRIIECWYRTPTTVTRMRGGDFAGEIFDTENPAPAHKQAIDDGNAEAVVRTGFMRMHVALFCSTGMLHHQESPYRHNGYPFTPIWCYRRDRDNMPYGMIRGMRDIQEDINKRASKALHILSTNKVIMDEGAVSDIDEFADEVSRPDAILVKKKGYELTINAERELAPAHLELMSRSMSMIQTLSGVTDENMGRQSNATSGLAIGRRQEQGAMTTAGIFDNLRFAVQVHGEKELSLIEQYFSDQKDFRITNMRGTPEYITINDGMPENDIVLSKADFIISDADWRASVRQAQTEELFALLQQLAPVAPQVALVMLDLIVEGMDITSRDAIVQRIRQVTGMKDPDQQEMTPEEQAEEQAKAQAAQQQQQMQQRAMLAEVGLKEAQAAKAGMSVQLDQAKVAQIQGLLAGTNVATQMAALQAAIQAISVPAAVPVADGMMHEAGFASRTEQEQETQAAMLQQAQQQQAEQQQQQAQQAQQEQQAAQQQQQPSQGIGLPQLQPQQ